MTTVTDIVREYLVARGYDGLYSESGECACLHSDLAPCGCVQVDCRPGYRATCQPDAEERCESCSEGGWHIQETRP